MSGFEELQIESGGEHSEKQGENPQETVKDQHALISKILKSNDWTESEKSVVKWQFRLCGDFKTALWEAIIRADEDNLARLRYGFPNEVAGYKAWAWTEPYSLATKLREAGLEI